MHLYCCVDEWINGLSGSVNSDNLNSLKLRHQSVAIDDGQNSETHPQSSNVLACLIHGVFL